MDFSGRYLIPAPPDAVWSALHDPDVLAACIPGCHGVTRLSDTAYEAKATLKVGPLKATFSGKVTWTDMPLPAGFTHAGVLSGEGQGGAVGFARGTSQIFLASDGAGTSLTYDARANIGGKLAQIGQRLIDASAKAVADDFFSKFDALMRARVEVLPKVEAAAAPTASQRTQQSNRLIWILALGAGLILILLAFWVL
jgi:carbon monoxide dehydrogenase subunit G